MHTFKMLGKKNFIIVFALFFFIFLPFVQATWWNDDWTKKRPINVWVTNGTTKAGYQLPLNITYDTDMRLDFGDLRFVNGSENVELPYWVETKIDGQWAYVWVRVDQNISNITNYTFYMYYGNPTATTKSNVTATFIREICCTRLAVHLDEGTGTIVRDTSGHGNNGSFVGTPSWVDGKFKRAVRFDGRPETDGILGALEVNFSLPYSMTSWIYPETIYPGEGWGPIIGDEEWGSGVLSLILSPPPDYVSPLRFYAGFLTPSFIFNGSVYRYRWSFVAVTLNGTTTKLYINDTVVGTFTQTGSPPPRRWIMGATYSPYFHTWRGILDEGFIYNKSLTPAEISDLYHNYGYTTLNYPGRVLVRLFHFPEPLYSLGAEEEMICYCNSCVDCNTKLNNITCKIVRLTTNIINHEGTCINNPVNFSNKIFDCQGFTIDGARQWWGDWGVYLNDKQNNTIKNCITTDFYCGIRLEYSLNNNLTNNTANNNRGGAGICLAYSSNNTIINNTLNNNIWFGIHLYFSSNNIITNNTANNNSWAGINFAYSPNNTITNNIVNNNRYGVYFDALNANNKMFSNYICNNSEYDVYAVILNYATGDNNTCDKTLNYSDNGVTGCKHKCDDCFCVNCTDCNTKLNDVACKRVFLTANIINHTGTCIDNPAGFNNKTFDCQKYMIDGDRIGTDFGIYLREKNHNTIRNCIITDFVHGIYLEYSSNNTITNNIVTNNDWNGIHIGYLSFDNVIISNRACNNSIHDIAVHFLNQATGDNNTCDKTVYYNDAGVTGCRYKCVIAIFNCTFYNLSVRQTYKFNNVSYYCLPEGYVLCFTINDTTPIRKRFNVSCPTANCSYYFGYYNVSAPYLGYIPPARVLVEACKDNVCCCSMTFQVITPRERVAHIAVGVVGVATATAGIAVFGRRRR